MSSPCCLGKSVYFMLAITINVCIHVIVKVLIYIIMSMICPGVMFIIGTFHIINAIAVLPYSKGPIHFKSLLG